MPRFPVESVNETFGILPKDALCAKETFYGQMVPERARELVKKVL